MRLGSVVGVAAGVLSSSLVRPLWAAEVAPTAQQSTAAKEGGSGLREVVVLNLEVGPAYVDTVALKDADLLDSARVRTSGFGVAYGAALGARWHEFTFAATYRRGDFSDWQLSTVCGELAMRFRLGAFVPHLGFGAGYAALTGAVADVSRTLAPDPPTAIEISGLNVRVSVGLDYYLLGWLSLGANLSGDAFFLRRHGDRLIRTSSTDVSSPPAFPYGLDGSGNGLGATLSVLLGLHY